MLLLIPPEHIVFGKSNVSSTAYPGAPVPRLKPSKHLRVTAREAMSDGASEFILRLGFPTRIRKPYKYEYDKTSQHQQ